MARTHWLLSLDCPLSPELHIQLLVGCSHPDTSLELLKLGEVSFPDCCPVDGGCHPSVVSPISRLMLSSQGLPITLHPIVFAFGTHPRWPWVGGLVITSNRTHHPVTLDLSASFIGSQYSKHSSGVMWHPSFHILACSFKELDEFSCIIISLSKLENFILFYFLH